MAEGWRLPPTPFSSAQGDGGAAADQQAYQQQLLEQQQGGGSRLGRPILHTGDPNAKDITDADRRRLKRRVANRESARRVREKRVEALCSTRDRLEQTRAHVKALSAQLQETEARRELMVRRLAYVVQEHRKMEEAAGDIGSPGPSSHMNGSPSGLQAPDMTTSAAAAAAAAAAAYINSTTSGLQVPAMTSSAAAYIHPHVDLGSHVPGVPHPAVPAAPSSMLPPAAMPHLAAPSAAAINSYLSDVTARGAACGAPAIGGHLSCISNQADLPAHPVALRGGHPAAAGPRRIVKSASSPGRFGGAPGGLPGSFTLGRNPPPPIATHRSQSTIVGFNAPSTRLNFASPQLPPSLPTYSSWPGSRHGQPALHGPLETCMPEEPVVGQHPQDVDMLRSLLLEGF